MCFLTFWPSILLFNFGKDYFICHAYSLAENGASKLFIREMQWDAEGWPIVNW